MLGAPHPSSALQGLGTTHGQGSASHSCAPCHSQAPWRHLGPGQGSQSRSTTSCEWKETEEVLNSQHYTQTLCQLLARPRARQSSVAPTGPAPSPTCSGNAPCPIALSCCRARTWDVHPSRAQAEQGMLVAEAWSHAPQAQGLGAAVACCKLLSLVPEALPLVPCAPAGTKKERVCASLPIVPIYSLECWQDGCDLVTLLGSSSVPSDSTVGR